MKYRILLMGKGKAAMDDFFMHLKDSYNVATAINGSLALKFLENKKTNLILLDYEMPVENGEQVLEKIRSNTATADLPVVFLTGVNDHDMVQKVLYLKP